MGSGDANSSRIWWWGCCSLLWGILAAEVSFHSFGGFGAGGGHGEGCGVRDLLVATQLFETHCFKGKKNNNRGGVIR